MIQKAVYYRGSAKYWPGSLRAVRTDWPLACSE